MKAANLELIEPLLGNSFTVKHYLEPQENEKANFWHFHPEIELVYVDEGSGVRHVGNHLSYYENGDLVLIGSNLPHNGFTNRHTGHREEVVIQFLNDFAGKGFWSIPEIQNIKTLLRRSLNGLAFSGNTKEVVGKELKMLRKLNPFERFICLLSILNKLAVSDEYEVLNAEAYSIDLNENKNQRASDVYKYIRKNFRSTISLETIAAVAAMTIPSFCRYFKNLSNKTFTQFLNEYRIIEACKLLSETDLPIGEVGLKVGFNSIAHFNKHFKLMTGKTPNIYRKMLEI